MELDGELGLLLFLLSGLFRRRDALHGGHRHGGRAHAKGLLEVLDELG